MYFDDFSNEVLTIESEMDDFQKNGPSLFSSYKNLATTYDSDKFCSGFTGNNAPINTLG